VKHAERKADFPGLLNILDGVKRPRVINKPDRSPERSFGIKPVVSAILCQYHAWQFPPTACAERDALQSPERMLHRNTHIPHDKRRPAKHPYVDALQDKALFHSGIHGYKKSVIYIAAPEFPDVKDLSLRPETRCNLK
jgi:hypothetical protein